MRHSAERMRAQARTQGGRAGLQLLPLHPCHSSQVATGKGLPGGQGAESSPPQVHRCRFWADRQKKPRRASTLSQPP